MKGQTIMIEDITRTAGTLTIRLSHDGGRYEPEDNGTRQHYTYVIQTNDSREYVGNDLFSGVNHEPDTHKMFGTLLSFMDAAAESYRYAISKGTAWDLTESGQLFPEWLAEALYANSDEIAMLALDFEDNDD